MLRSGVCAARRAGAIASASRPAVAAGKACIHGVDELGLAAGLELERREFWDCFDCADQKEGMHAFIEKRKPQFSD
jgi:enoyl-CoA hydratase/carnithine racemase